MYLHADQLPPHTHLQGYDICIVGAGAAGLAMAKRLIGTGRSVLVLASGSPQDRGRPEAARQQLYEGTHGTLLQQVDPIFQHRSRLHMYGGTTNHFGFWSRPLDPIDFRARPGYRDAQWPFDLAELIPYYQDAHHFGHFGPFNYADMPFWEQTFFARCFPTQPDSPLTGAIIRAQYEESLHDFQVQFGAELQAAENVTILFNAHLLRIETSADQRQVLRLHGATLEAGQAGRSFSVQAGQYVLAMGGIENVRQLMMADNLGNNPADHLGRGFMVHPLVTNAARVRFAQPVPLEIRSFFRDHQIRLQPPLTAGEAYTHMSAPLVNPEDLFGYAVFNAWGILVPTAAALEAEGIGNFRLILRFSPAGDEAVVNINWEQVPNEHSRLTLDPQQRDPIFRQPVAHVDWRMLPVDKETIRRGLALCESYLRTVGATDFRLLTDLSGGPDDWPVAPHEGALATGDHHMGALRMSAEAAEGIVNPDSRVYTVDNLYVAGCAVFPTGGYANPTLTIVALALRLADHLLGRG
jgi:choline dehydrogenase-like flavoprotein